MERIQVRMLRSKDRLEAGQVYNLPHHLVQQMLRDGVAEEVTRVLEPSETQYVGPTEFKQVKDEPIIVKKKGKRESTASS